MFFRYQAKAKAGPPAEIEQPALAGATDGQDDFALFYERYFPRVYRYCLRRLGQPEEAEDVAAQIFTRAMAGLGGYKGGSEAAWLFRIAHNAVANHLRSRRPQVSFEAARENGLADEWASPEEGLPEKLVRLEEKQELARLIAKLPEKERELLALSVGGGLTAREVGQVLGKSERAVWTALHRIIKKLKADYWKQYGPEEKKDNGPEAR